MTAPVLLGWAEPAAVYPLAFAAAALLLLTIWLFRRRRATSRPAAAICLVLSLALHVALLWWLPLALRPGTDGGQAPRAENESGTADVSLRLFAPEESPADAATSSPPAAADPLPVTGLQDWLWTPPQAIAAAAGGKDPEQPNAAAGDTTGPDDPESGGTESGGTESGDPESVPPRPLPMTPETLFAGHEAEGVDGDRAADAWQELDDGLSEWFEQAFIEDAADETAAVASVAATETATGGEPGIETDAERDRPGAAPPTTSGMVSGRLDSDFANRVGSAKQIALEQTGGDARTEAAVQAALRFLCQAQRPDGAWDPAASGAGQERAPLGETRDGAGKRAETAITGLALLALMGAGHTHQAGDHADHVYRGLAFLIRGQKADGSLAGNASLYAAHYSHGMAALAMAEAAAITRDPAAIEATRRAVRHTQRMQHPTTGGFRYRPGETGDMSQLGWQAMVLDAAFRADVAVDPAAIRGIQTFLRSVRGGTHGGLARYRPGEAPSRTMTAEALAIRLLLGEAVPQAEIEEAQRYMLEQPPGVGQDNYYYWYYATMALHQLQDDAWERWNAALRERLLATQRPDGSWSDATVWGGYGGTVYTTAMATLCLESYYRHSVRPREERIATQRP